MVLLVNIRLGCKGLPEKSTILHHLGMLRKADMGKNGTTYLPRFSLFELHVEQILLLVHVGHLIQFRHQLTRSLVLDLNSRFIQGTHTEVGG